MSRKFYVLRVFLSGDMTLNLYCLFVFSRREAEAAAMAAAVEKQKVTDRSLNFLQPLPKEFFLALRIWSHIKIVLTGL